MQRIAFVLKHHEMKAVELGRTLIRQLSREKNKYEMFVLDSDLANHLDIPVIHGNALPFTFDLLVVLGGDGTLLHAAKILGLGHTPVLAINLGRLGFLSTGSEQEAIDLLQKALLGELQIEGRTQLLYQILRRPQDHPLQKGTMQYEEANTELLYEGTALNDVVFSQPSKARLFELSVDVNNEFVTRYNADGLIVSTPTGSTAYNLAAGGPIVLPSVDSMTLTPICSHALTARPLVLPGSSFITIVQADRTDQVMVTADGQSGRVLDPATMVRIQISPYRFPLFRKIEYSFFDVLRTKLHWGVRG